MKYIRRLAIKFRSSWKNYIWQSVAATCGISVALVVFRIHKSPIIIASLGATTFIVFAMPSDITAKGYHVIGGHCIGIVCGLVCGMIPDINTAVTVFSLALSVGISLFVMVASDTEHPPACGTAMGIAHAEFNPLLLVSLVAAAVILALIRALLKPYLKDLV